MVAPLIPSVPLDLLARVIRPEDDTLSLPAAEALLTLGFCEEDVERHVELAARSNQGELTPEEAAEFAGFVFLDEFLSVLRAKARLRTSAGSVDADRA